MISKRHRYDQGQFAILPKEAINNAALTFAARGLLLYLLEKPVDWRVSNEHLYSQSPAGERHINTILSELKAAGYVHREKVYDPPTRTFRWDTTVYDFPEDNPHFDPTRIPTFRMDTERMDTERTPTKRGDDLILDLPIPNEDTPLPARDPESECEYEPEHPAELLRQLAGVEPSGKTAPLAATEDEFQAAARAYETAARAAQLARMSPAERQRVEARERMVEMLARVTDVTVKANRGRLESVAAKIDEFTPEQIWRGFGDPASSWWWQEWYKGKTRGQKPTLYDVQEFAGRAVNWQPPAAVESGSNGKGATTPAAVIDRSRAEAAWASVLRAVNRFGSNRDRDAVAMLDETTAAALRAIGGTPTVRTMNPGVNDKTVRARFMEAYREATERAGRITAQVGAGEAQPAGHRQGQFAPAAAD